MPTCSSPISHLERLLAGQSEFSVGNRKYTVQNLRHENGLGFFATFRTPRAEYLAMQVDGRVSGRPQAEVWTVMATGGRGRKVVDFAIDQDRVLVLA